MLCQHNPSIHSPTIIKGYLYGRMKYPFEWKGPKSNMHEKGVPIFQSAKLSTNGKLLIFQTIPHSDFYSSFRIGRFLIFFYFLISFVGLHLYSIHTEVHIGGKISLISQKATMIKGYFIPLTTLHCGCSSGYYIVDELQRNPSIINVEFL